MINIHCLQFKLLDLLEDRLESCKLFYYLINTFIIYFICTELHYVITLPSLIYYMLKNLSLSQQTRASKHSLY